MNSPSFVIKVLTYTAFGRRRVNPVLATPMMNVLESGRPIDMQLKQHRENQNSLAGISCTVASSQRILPSSGNLGNNFIVVTHPVYIVL